MACGALRDHTGPRDANDPGERLKKKPISPVERYAVWEVHGRRCLVCREPLPFARTTIDHFLPEWLLGDDAARAAAFAEFGLGNDSEIHSAANWLPAHQDCNRFKGPDVPEAIPWNQALLKKLRDQAPRVAAIEKKITSDGQRGRIFTVLLQAIAERRLSLADVLGWIDDLTVDAGGLPDGTVFLDEGYAYSKEEIVREGWCTCERNACVGRPEKVYTYFTSDLPPWVVETGLFRDCYDEIIQCPRCGSTHKRGHAGRAGSCPPQP